MQKHKNRNKKARTGLNSRMTFGIAILAILWIFFSKKGCFKVSLIKVFLYLAI